MNLETGSNGLRKPAALRFGLVGGLAAFAAGVAAVLAVVVSACSTDGGERPRALAPGDTMPMPELPDDRFALVWVFEAEECLGCELTGPAQQVRLLQRRLGSRMETAVVAVSNLGEDDRALVERFLESQRLSAQVVMRSPVEYRHAFGAAPVPAFYVVGRDRVVLAIPSPDRLESWLSSPDSLHLNAFLEALAEEQKAPGNTVRQ